MFANYLGNVDVSDSSHILYGQVSATFDKLFKADQFNVQYFW